VTDRPRIRLVLGVAKTPDGAVWAATLALVGPDGHWTRRELEGREATAETALFAAATTGLAALTKPCRVDVTTGDVAHADTLRIEVRRTGTALHTAAADHEVAIYWLPPSAPYSDEIREVEQRARDIAALNAPSAE
jgi:hypothetical protein